MSEHRYPCPAKAPVLTVTDVMTDHHHACIHDAAPLGPLAPEHECACGMSWIDPRETMRVYSNVPPELDVSWITPQPPETWLQRQPVWRILAAVFGGITLFFAAMIAIASAVGAP